MSLSGAAPLRPDANNAGGWKISATAIRSWQRLLGVAAGEDIETARRRLTAAAEEVRQRYQRNPDLAPEPRIGHPHLAVYRGGLPLRLRLTVDVRASEVADVIAVDGRKEAIDRYRAAVMGWEEAGGTGPQAPPPEREAKPAFTAYDPGRPGLNSRQRRELQFQAVRLGLACPWYVTPEAAWRFAAIVGLPASEDAMRTLIQCAADTWDAYREAGRAAALEAGRQVYRGRHAGRDVHLVVAREPGERGKDLVVDVRGGPSTS